MSEQSGNYDPKTRPTSVSQAIARADYKAGVKLVDITGIIPDPETGLVVAEDLKKPMKVRRKERPKAAGKVDPAV